MIFEECDYLTNRIRNVRIDKHLERGIFMNEKLLNQFVNSISYQSENAQQLLYDAKRLKKRWKIFRKKENSKNYFQIIMNNITDIKVLAKKTNTLYNNLIAFMVKSEWEEKTIKYYITMQKQQAQLYYSNIVGSFEILKNYFQERTLTNKINISDKAISDYLDFVENSINCIINDIKIFETQHKLNSMKASQLRTLLLSQTPQWISEDMLNECIDRKYLKSEMATELLKMIDENNKRYEQYQVQLRIQKEEQEKQEIFEYQELSNINHSLDSFIIETSGREVEYMTILKNFYYDQKQIKQIIFNILDRITIKEYYKLINLIKKEIDIYQELKTSNGKSKKDRIEIKNKLKYWKQCLINLKQYEKLNQTDEYLVRDVPCHFLFATNNVGTPYILRDIEKFNSEETKISFLTCLDNLRLLEQYQGNFTKIRKLGNDDSLDVFESKCGQVRVIYKYLPYKCFYIIQVSIKKRNNDNHLKRLCAKRVVQTTEEYKRLKSEIKTYGFTNDLLAIENQIMSEILTQINSKTLQKGK